MAVKLITLLILVLVVRCGPLGDPQNGAVTVTSSTFGSVAIYSCDAGFQLVGATQRTCQADGFWSSSEPLCRSKPCRTRLTNQFLV